MVHPWNPGVPVPESTTAVLMGPGLAAEGIRRERENEVISIWRRGGFPVVADASVLDWLPPVPLAPTLLRVMTPHPGEAARLLRRHVAEIQSDRVRTVRELSRRYSDCHVVLKGNQTVVGRSSGPVFVNPSGNPGLAQGGSGDLLAGLIAGLLAQPALQQDPMRTLRFAAWRHGVAADRLTAQGRDWTIEELVMELGSATTDDWRP
jgi:NAD(P)H-hydrate epimerase